MRVTDPWFEAEFIGQVNATSGSHRRQGGELAGLHDLTLTPSINCQAEKPEHVEALRAAGLKVGECRTGRMCWHGFITNGEVTT